MVEPVLLHDLSCAPGGVLAGVAFDPDVFGSRATRRHARQQLT